MSLLNETLPESTHVESPVVETAPTSNTNEPSWWLDENTPGFGERPGFLPEKYKTVADVVKAHKELEQRLGKAPSEYDFSKGESWIEPDYEPFQQMAEYAKSKHVPQDVMDKMLETVGLYLDEFKPDLAEEKAKLGENATERLQKLNNWAKSNLSEQAFQVLSGTMRTAEAIEALEEIRNKMLSGNTIVPGGNEASATSGLTLDDYRSELNANYARYKTDAAYRRDMERKLESIVVAQNLKK
jgi:hypothetical protein